MKKKTETQFKILYRVDNDIITDVLMWLNVVAIYWKRREKADFTPETACKHAWYHQYGNS